MNALFQAIYNKYNSDTAHGAYTNVSGRFYHNNAPQKSDLPFIVYFAVDDINEVDFGEEKEDFLIQFNIFSQNNSAEEAGNILTNLKSLFDECDLTVTDWRHVYMQRARVIPNNDFSQVPPVHGYSIDYNILIEKTK